MTPKQTVILAIDDEKDVLYTLQAIGTAMGWRIHTETDSLTAMGKLRLINPDLILVDYHMPKQDGLTTVRAIRQRDKKTPIIILTVDERQEVADQFLDAGASDFANKPIKVPDLAARIKVHIGLLQKQRETAESAICSKGINEATLDLVRTFCSRINRPFIIKDVADHVGLAYQTAVRYLQHMQANGELTVANNYGKIGRPRKKYEYAK